MNERQDVTIRDAEASDVARMFRISVAAHRASYGPFIPADQLDRFIGRYTINETNEREFTARILHRIRDPRWHVWVAVERHAGTVLGYTLACTLAPDILQKRGLFVDPDAQGHGIGTMLFDHSLSAIDSGTIQLSVIENNEKAIHVYEKGGFTRVGYDDKSFFGARRIVMRYKK